MGFVESNGFQGKACLREMASIVNVLMVRHFVFYRCFGLVMKI